MVSHVTSKNAARHPKFRFVSWWTIRNQNFREINNATKNSENLILREEPFLTVHMSLTKLKMKFISCYTVTVLQIIIRQQFINDIK